MDVRQPAVSAKNKRTDERRILCVRHVLHHAALIVTKEKLGGWIDRAGGEKASLHN
jgi:hypothetical protein